MANVLTLRDLIADSVTLYGVYCYKGMRDQVDTPCAVIGLPRNVQYDVTFNTDEAEYEFVLRLLVGRADEVVAEERLAEWLSPGTSSMKALIEDDPALASLDATVQVQQATGLGIYRYGEIDYLGVEIVVIVTA